jgi:hypothetical protein
VGQAQFSDGRAEGSGPVLDLGVGQPEAETVFDNDLIEVSLDVHRGIVKGELRGDLLELVADGQERFGQLRGDEGLDLVGAVGFQSLHAQWHAALAGLLRVRVVVGVVELDVLPVFGVEIDQVGDRRGILGHRPHVCGDSQFIAH